MKKKMLGILLATAMTTVMLGGCGSSKEETSGGAATTETVEAESTVAGAETAESSEAVSVTEITGETISVKALGEFDPQISGQQIIAKEMGFFEEEGLDVDLELLTDPSISTTMIASGEAQFYSASQYQNINLVDKGTDVCVIAPVVNAGNTQVVVGGPNLEVTSAKDLEGKKMGYTDGAGVIVAVKNMCEDLGVDFDKIELVNLQAADMLASLERGDIDFFAAWEPWGLKAEAFGGKVLFTGTQSYLPENTGEVDYLDFIVCINANRDFYESDPDACAAYVRAMIKATDYINNNMEEASKIIAEQINLEQEECYNIMQKNSYAVTFDKTYKDSCESLAAYMQESGMTNSLVSYESFNEDSILTGVDASLVDYTK